MATLLFSETLQHAQLPYETVVSDVATTGIIDAMVKADVATFPRFVSCRCKPNLNQYRVVAFHMASSR